jgi:hypothetical protein
MFDKNLTLSDILGMATTPTTPKTTKTHKTAPAAPQSPPEGQDSGPTIPTQQEANGSATEVISLTDVANEKLKCPNLKCNWTGIRAELKLDRATMSHIYCPLCGAHVKK